MRAITRSISISVPILLVLATGGVAACSLSGLTFDLTGAGGSASTSASASGGASSPASAATSTSTGPDPGACGNTIVDPGEQCDDGNLVALDGCSPTCTTEVLETCPGAQVHVTEAGLTINGTLAGKTEDLTPSCGVGVADAVYAVIPSVSGTLAATLLIGNSNSNGLVSIRSTCADGLASELVCKPGNGASAQIWVDAGVTYWVVASGDATFYNLDLKLSACGNGQLEGLEECDDPADVKCVGCTKCNASTDFRDPASKHCYRISPFMQKTWSAARAMCVAWGGDLAALGSKAEADYVAAKIQIGAAWLGGTDAAKECDFTWSNGEPWHAKWDSGEPSDGNGNGEDCVLLSKNGGMSDYPCTNAFGYICERAPAGKCGDGIISPGEECDDLIISPSFTCSGCKLTCKPGEFEDPATRHCYRVVPDLVTAPNASAACVAFGATLAAVNTPAENALIQAHITAQTWIGVGVLQQGRWSNGDPLCYSNAPGGGPNSGCATMLPDGTWNNAGCNAARAYVCEREN
jgi:cysteine-rich repeat protein